MPEWEQEASMAQGNGVTRLRTGERLRSLREHLGIGRGEASRRAGISRFQLAAYERGMVAVPDDVVACLARAYGVSAGEVVPSRSHTRLRVADGALVAGETAHPLPADATPEEVLDHYLGFIREMRGARNLDELPLRDADLDTLAEALGGTPKEIERRLVELIHCTRDEARTIRRALLRRRLVVPVAGFALGVGGLGSAAALKDGAGPTAMITDDAETARTVELDVESPAAPPEPVEPVAAPGPAPEPAPEPVAEPAPPPPPEATNDAGEPITRSGSGENGDWAEVIPPVLITPDDTVQ